MAIFMWFFSLLVYKYLEYYKWNKEKIVFNNKYWIYIIFVFIFHDYYHKRPQSWWLTTAKIYFLTALEARSPKSRCRQGHVLCSLRRLPCLFQLLRSPSASWFVAAEFPALPPSSFGLLLPWLHLPLFSLSQIPLCLSRIRTLIVGFRAPTHII